jgi:putative PIN family toxin of toxin-antitoxin system
MRVVIDTNIVISAGIKNASHPAAVLLWIDLNGALLKSAATERELFEVLQRPRIAGQIVPGFVTNLRRIFDAAEFVPIVEPVRACRDARDDKFLELAVNGFADAIVSGDADLLVLNPFRGIAILNAATFSLLHVTAPR